jgi:hypothetical protein
LPSHSPSVPQVEGSVTAQVWRGSIVPAAAFLQMPGELASAHDRQAPSQASLQHRPSTQKVLAHSAPLPQVWPTPLRPQLIMVTSQVWPVAQSASLAQLGLQ